MIIWICRTSLSRIYLLKSSVNWLKTIKRAIIFGFAIGRTRFCFLSKNIRLMCIAAVCQVHRTAVSRWINNWNELGFSGLKDEEKQGRPPILSLPEQEKAFEIAMRNPKFPHRQIGEISRETGKTIGKQTLKRLVKKRLYLETSKVGTLETAKWRRKRVCPPRFGCFDKKSRWRKDWFGVFWPIGF